MKFDGLLLVDCWEDKWINLSQNYKARQFYKNIIKFISDHSFGNIYFSTNNDYRTHQCFYEYFENDITLVAKSQQVLGKTILVAGAAWDLCLHDPVLPSFVTLAHAGKTVYSSPDIVDTEVGSDTTVTDDMFKLDRRINWVKQDKLFYTT